MSHEYQTLRSEIRTHQDAQYNLQRTFVVLLAGGISAGFYLWDNVIASASIFLVAVPILVIVGLMGNIATGSTTMQIAKYIKKIEDKMQVLLGDEFKDWMVCIEKEAKESSSIIKNNKASVTFGRIVGWENFLSIEIRPRKHEIILWVTVFIVAFLIPVTIGEIRLFCVDAGQKLERPIQLVLGFVPLFIMVFGICAVLYFNKSQKKIIEP